MGKFASGRKTLEGKKAVLALAHRQSPLRGCETPAESPGALQRPSAATPARAPDLGAPRSGVNRGGQGREYSQRAAPRGPARLLRGLNSTAVHEPVPGRRGT